jgi:AcrR family transcriptional regulator
MPSVTKGKTAHRANRAAAATRIVQATERLLRSGERFTEIPVERLLVEADVSRSTFYVHFSDKSALLLAVAAKSVSEVVSAAASFWVEDRGANPATAEPAIRDLIAVYRRHAAVLRTLAEVGAYDDEIRDVWRAARGQQEDRTAARLRRDQRRGLVPAGIDIPLTASAVMQLIDGAILEHIAHGSPHKDRALAATLARVAWLACYGQVPARLAE